MTFTPKLLTDLAYFFTNTDRQTLEAAGIIQAGKSGDDKWKRFNHNFDIFILKANDEQLEALARLANSYIGTSSEPEHQATPYGAATTDYLGCEYFSFDVENIEKIAAAGSQGPTGVIYLYAGSPPCQSFSKTKAADVKAESREGLEPSTSRSLIERANQTALPTDAASLPQAQLSESSPLGKSVSEDDIVARLRDVGACCNDQTAARAAYEAAAEIDRLRQAPHPSPSDLLVGSIVVSPAEAKALLYGVPKHEFTTALSRLANWLAEQEDGVAAAVSQGSDHSLTSGRGIPRVRPPEDESTVAPSREADFQEFDIISDQAPSPPKRGE